MKELEEHLDYVDSENVATYRMSFSSCMLARVLPLLNAIIAIDPDAEIDEDRWDSGGAWVRWKRPLRPEEIAKRERDARENEAKRNADAYTKERAEYERLKAKFGDA